MIDLNQRQPAMKNGKLFPTFKKSGLQVGLGFHERSKNVSPNKFIKISSFGPRKVDSTVKLGLSPADWDCC